MTKPIGTQTGPKVGLCCHCQSQDRDTCQTIAVLDPQQVCGNPWWYLGWEVDNRNSGKNAFMAECV